MICFKIESQLAGVKTNMKPMHMKRTPASFISENNTPLYHTSNPAEAGTAAIRPKVMKFS